MKHTFLMEPGKWRVDGEFYGARGDIVAASGETVITHGETEWKFFGVITLKNAERTKFTNEYTVTPFGPGAVCTPWISLNPHVGKLIGSFTLIGDTLVSQYRSEDGRYRGNEHLVHWVDGKYHCTGAFYDGDALVSGWNVTLVNLKGLN